LDFTTKIKEAFNLVTVNHGWEMAVLGGLIVFTGLVLLSFAISQFHKFLPYWEKRDEYLRNLTGKPEEEQKDEKKPAKTKEKPSIPSPDRMPESIKETAEIYQPLVDLLGTPFKLEKLYEISCKNNFPHPHLTIKNFMETGILQPDEKGDFTWNV